MPEICQEIRIDLKQKQSSLVFPPKKLLGQQIFVNEFGFIGTKQAEPNII